MHNTYHFTQTVCDWSTASTVLQALVYVEPTVPHSEAAPHDFGFDFSNTVTKKIVGISKNFYNISSLNRPLR